MKTKYYHFRDEKSRPIVTVCILETENGCYSGMSLCSQNDNPDKSLGRLISFNRAMKVFENEHFDNMYPINRIEAKDVIQRLDTEERAKLWVVIGVHCPTPPRWKAEKLCDAA